MIYIYILPIICVEAGRFKYIIISYINLTAIHHLNIDSVASYYFSLRKCRLMTYYVGEILLESRLSFIC